MNKVVYVTKGGNTKKLADAIAKGAGVSALSLEQFHAFGVTELLFVGASIYAGAIDTNLRKFLSDLGSSQVTNVVVFGTSAAKKTALPEIKSILESKGIVVSSEEFHCKGSFLFANRGRPNKKDLEQAEAFAKKIVLGSYE